MARRVGPVGGNVRKSALAAVVAGMATMLAAMPVVEAGVDPAFGSSGRWFDEGVPEAEAVVRSDGTIVVGGRQDGSGVVLEFAELGADGALTNGLGGTGRVTLDTSPFPGADNEIAETAGAVALPSGTTVHQFVTSIGATFVALRPNGTLDPSFSTDGFLSEQFVACGKVTGLNVVPTDDGYLTVSHELSPMVNNGNAIVPNPCHGTVVRKYTSTGQRVLFGNEGADGSHHDGRFFAQALDVDASGRALLSGVSDDNLVAVARLTADGDTDTSFGTDGLITFDPAPAVAFAAYGSQDGLPRLFENTLGVDLRVDSAGRVLVVGSSAQTEGGDLEIWSARLTPSGQLDGSYGTGGIAWANLNDGQEFVLSIDLDAQDRPIISGATHAGPVNSTNDTPGPDVDPQARPDRSVFTVRLGANGQLDPTALPVVTDFDQSTDHVPLHQVLDGDRVVVSGIAESQFGFFRGFASAYTLTEVPSLPSRVLDTREGGGRFGPGETRTVSLDPADPPAGAVAASVNITAVRADTATYVSAWPTGSDKPATSSLNPIGGEILANSVLLGIGEGNSISVFNQVGTVDLVIDVENWIMDDGGFTPLQPIRRLDTRDELVPFAAEEERVIQITGGGVPEEATAVAVNITAVNGSTETVLRAWPTDGAVPNISVLNVAAGRALSNGFLTALDAEGRLSIHSSTGPVHVIVDVLGWFDAGGFVPVGPTRLMDTRFGLGGTTIPAGQSVTLSVVPDGVAPWELAGVALNVTAVRPTTGTYLTVWPSGHDRPLASTLNVAAGTIVANGIVARVGIDGAINIYNPSGDVDVVVDILGLVPA